jgi:predicted ArsR family transcriptional regulator
MKLVEYVKNHVGDRNPHQKEEEDLIYGLLKEDPTLTITKIAKKTKLHSRTVQMRLTTLASQHKIKYVRMWVPLDEIDSE